MSSSILLPVGSAVFSDGSASNVAPTVTRIKSTGSDPVPFFLQLEFDPDTPNIVHWQFRMPLNFLANPILKVQWKTSVTTGSVVWESRIVSYTPVTDTTSIDVAGFNASNSTTTPAPSSTAGQIIETSISLTNNGSLAANDFVILMLRRIADSGSDTCTGPARVVAVTLEYS